MHHSDPPRPSHFTEPAAGEPDLGDAPEVPRTASTCGSLALGLLSSSLGGSIVLLELLFRTYGREAGFSERDGGGCLTIVGLIPMVVGGYLFGVLGAAVAIIGLLLATKARSRSGMVLSVLGLIASLLGIGATALMHVDIKNW